MKKLKIPPQPMEKDWKFIAELKKPYWQKVAWNRKYPENNEVCLGNGVRVEENFSDSETLLDTAYADLRRFLKLGRIARNENYKIVTAYNPTQVPETFSVKVTSRECKILAGDTEGIRRGIYFVEDEMLRRQGPFLPLGSIYKPALIRTRISRPYWGGNSFPESTEQIKTFFELYIGDEYLNRAAHHGINGFFHTFSDNMGFRDICPSKIIPGCGKDSTHVFAALRFLVRRYARFGIKCYIYCTEPRAFPHDSEIPAGNRELAGHRTENETRFCTSSAMGQAYLEEAVYNLFSAVPGLGGLINICCGERPTNCCSGGAGVNGRLNNCPRCSKLDPHDVIAGTLAAMERGMHAAAPDAVLIAWPYSQYFAWGKKETVKTAGRIPKGVVLQHNFEGGGTRTQLGKIRTFDDYWLSWPGPSKLFRDCAEAAAGNNTEISAKIMVSCSHEVESVPFVPVPGIIYDKYKAMRELNVSSTLMCWGSGSYPSVNYRAANELSFGGFPDSKKEFLRSLAEHDWGKNASEVLKAWSFFERGYKNFPVNHVFGYYGPMHDAPVWPLHLKPVDQGLTPNWKFSWPYISGDRIGECVTYSHTLEETLLLCKRMSEYWHRGAVILESLLSEYAGDAERLKDIHVAMALDCQFASGFNVLRFYALRERMFRSDTGRIALLRQMRTIVEAELKIDEKMLFITRSNAFAGFTSEANGYRYFPAKIKWRMKQLRQLLDSDFAQVEKIIRSGRALFPEYTGQKPKGAVYRCRRFGSTPLIDGDPSGKNWDELESVECGYKAFSSHGQYTPLAAEESARRKTCWKAGYDDNYIYLGILCTEPDMAGLCDDYKDRKMPNSSGNDCVVVQIEPRRLWPCRKFIVNAKGARRYEKVRLETGRFNWDAAARQGKGTWSVTIRIPFAEIGDDAGPGWPLRVNILRNLPEPPAGHNIHSWMPLHPLPPRLVWNTENPQDLGWLVFD